MNFADPMDPDTALAQPRVEVAGSGPVPRRVVVIDDHEVLRAGTRRILDDAVGFSVVGEAGDANTAIEVIAEVDPDVVLVDIRLPGLNGIDLARRIVNEYPSVTVLILSAYDDQDYIRAALAAGVAGYLLKTMPSSELILSISAACEGLGFLDPRPQAKGETDDLDFGNASAHLTLREHQVVRLVARGMSNKAIAQTLGISPRTVEGHLNHIFDKLNATSRTELVHYALANSLFVRDQFEGSDSDS